MAYLSKFDPTFNDWRTKTPNTMSTKHAAFKEKELGHAPWGYDHYEAVAWAIGYNAALEKTAAPELLEALELYVRPYAALSDSDLQSALNGAYFPILRGTDVRALIAARAAIAKATK